MLNKGSPSLALLSNTLPSILSEPLSPPASPYQSPIAGLVWGNAAPGKHEQGLWGRHNPEDTCSTAYRTPRWELPKEEGEWVRGQLGTERLPSRILCGGYPFMPVPPPQALGWIKS